MEKEPKEQIEGILEIDHDRGVIYFHCAQTGHTSMRICRLPTPLPNPVKPTCINQEDLVFLDITWGHGVNWEKKVEKPDNPAIKVLENQIDFMISLLRHGNSLPVNSMVDIKNLIDGLYKGTGNFNFSAEEIGKAFIKAFENHYNHKKILIDKVLEILRENCHESRDPDRLTEHEVQDVLYLLKNGATFQSIYSETAGIESSNKPNPDEF